MDETNCGPGRRIYVHTMTLRSLALQRRDIAEWIAAVLGRIRAARILNHHLIDQALNYGLLSTDAVSQAYRPFQNVWKEDLTKLLRAVGYRPSVPRDRSIFLAILEVDEQVISSCFDKGYYTFATTEAATERMLADSEPISQLYKSLKAGSGPDDLVLLRGRCLALIDPEIGIGKVGAYYAPKLSQHQVESRELDEIDKRMRSEVIEWVKLHLENISSGLTDPTEQRLLVECIRALTVTLADRSSL